MKFFKSFKKENTLYWSLEALILISLIFILTKLDFIYQPLFTFFSTLSTPILIAGFLFYMLNPVVQFMEKKMRIKRIFGIVIVFFILLAIIVFTLLNFIPHLIEQITSFTKDVPSYIRDIQRWLLSLTKYPFFKNIDFKDYIEKLDFSYGSIITKTLNGTANYINSLLSVVTTTLIIIVTVPFVLFYMLKDGKKFKYQILKFIPQKRRQKFERLLEDMNNTIATYINGQAIECLFVGSCMIIGYFILGIDYAFLFGVIAGLANLIPYLGPYIGLAFSFLATVFENPLKALMCIILVIIVQQIDGNVIYPNVIGKTLKIHPLTIIFVLMVAGNIAGLLGIFLGVPIYAISKIILKFVANIYKTNKEQTKSSTS
ncbi:MAG: AI-2E family transporter [Streptococcaceae bacterium]|nr:AI-2E family transporter [Streptococcaceae bacterium]